MKKPKVYLAGNMRRRKYMNFLQFDLSKAWLESRGVSVISPADLDRDAGYDPVVSMTKNLPSQEDCLKRDVNAITKVDAICLLPNTNLETGRGVMFEIAAALFLNKNVYQL